MRLYENCIRPTDGGGSGENESRRYFRLRAAFTFNLGSFRFDRLKNTVLFNAVNRITNYILQRTTGRYPSTARDHNIIIIGTQYVSVITRLRARPALRRFGRWS